MSHNLQANPPGHVLQHQRALGQKSGLEQVGGYLFKHLFDPFSSKSLASCLFSDNAGQIRARACYLIYLSYQITPFTLNLDRLGCCCQSLNDLKSLGLPSRVG